jgi:sugar/nucleoside kinase (ribokinase family)
MIRSLSRLAGPIIVAGHSCLDIIPTFPAGSAVPDPGKLAAVGRATLATGGATPNVGIALHKLGAPVRLVSLIGDDLFGTNLRDQLLSTGVDVRLDVRAGAPTSYSVVLSPPDVDRSFLHCPGVNELFDPTADIRDEDLQGAIALHFGYPPSMRMTYIDEGKALAGMFRRCRQMGIVTSLDLNSPDPSVVAAIEWRKWFERVLPEVSMFCPSVGEYCALVRRPGTYDRGEIAELAGEILDMGATLACIKMGARGIYVRQCEEEIWQDCLPAKFVSATGSGDCTIAGLLAGQLCGYSLADSARLACAVGAFSVESATATGAIPGWEKVVKRSGIQSAGKMR